MSRPLGTAIAEAYSTTADAWRRGPSRVYDRLAEVLVARCPLTLAGQRVVDVGAGTGSATRAAIAAGAAIVVAVDAAFGMLALDAGARPAAVVADAAALPFAAATFDTALAAFSLNHLADPVAGVRELARVTRRGGAIAFSAYAAGDDHAVKRELEAELAHRGWRPAPWYRALRAAAANLATPDRCRAAAAEAGVAATSDAVRVPFADLDDADLVRWRLGMAQHADFVVGLTSSERDEIVALVAERIGGAPPLVRSVIVTTARV